MTRGEAFFVKAGKDEYVVIARDTPRWVAALTPAEREVASAVLRGATNKAIARTRGVSERTVANQLARIYDKLRVRSRAELAAMILTAP